MQLYIHTLDEWKQSRLTANTIEIKYFLPPKAKTITSLILISFSVWEIDIHVLCIHYEAPDLDYKSILSSALDNNFKLKAPGISVRLGTMGNSFSFQVVVLFFFFLKAPQPSNKSK